MDTSLSKKQLQETLRQMGIDYSSTASREDLLQRLQCEDQNLWMKLASGAKALHNSRILRKKSQDVDPVSEAPQKGEGVAERSYRDACATRQPKKRVSPPAPVRRAGSGGKVPALDLPRAPRAPVFQSEKELENYALNRAGGVCDLCESAMKEGENQLTACFFTDPPAGRHLTGKEVVALCPDCFERVRTQRLSRDIKILKRKARRKRIGEVKISKRG